MKTKKLMNISNANSAKDNISDLVLFGMDDPFKCLAKASSEKYGWMKSTKAMNTPTGVLYQVTTQQQSTEEDGHPITYAVSESLVHVVGEQVVRKQKDGVDTNEYHVILKKVTM